MKAAIFKTTVGEWAGWGQVKKNAAKLSYCFKLLFSWFSIRWVAVKLYFLELWQNWFWQPDFSVICGEMGPWNCMFYHFWWCHSRNIWMWGLSGYDFCHSIDRQGWVGWSGWLGRRLLPPSLLHVRPSPSCMLGWRWRPSPIEERTILRSSVYE